MPDDNTLIEQLSDALRCLPGVGPRSAQRMVWHLLERDRDGGRVLAERLAAAMDRIGHCARCRTFTENDVCRICASADRDGTLLCVVENPGDVQAIDHAATYRGLFFVTMGCLSPIDGIGPEEIGMPALVERCKDGVSEVILALSSTVEGEATSHYISEMLKPSGITVSRLAQGIPVGGELEFVDGGTLSHALEGRRPI